MSLDNPFPRCTFLNCKLRLHRSARPSEAAYCFYHHIIIIKEEHSRPVIDEARKIAQADTRLYKIQRMKERVAVSSIRRDLLKPRVSR